MQCYKLRNSFIAQVLTLAILESCYCNTVTTFEVTAVQCGIGEFDCGPNSNGRQCINSSQICDSNNDCDNGADETNCGASGQNYGVTIEASSTATSYTVGDNITLTCVVDSSITSNTSNISYTWTCSGCFADDMTTPMISHRLTSMDSSIIDCSATVDGFVYMTEIPFDLQVTQVPNVHAAECDSLVLAVNGKSTKETEFTVSPKPKNLRIRCQCANKTQPVGWFFSSGIEVQGDDRSKQIHTREKPDTSTLWIPSDTSPLEYVGVYRCTSTSSQTSINIVVTDPAVEVSVSPETTGALVVNGNETLMLTCSVTGLSGGTIQWRKDGSIIIDDSTRHTVNSNATSSILQINNLTKSDEGAYHCVYNHNGVAFNSSQAVVSIKGFIEVAVEPSDMLSVEVGNEVQLKCSANGYQEDMFMYQWKLNGSDISGAADKTLTISSANYNDSGMYECTVTNHWDDMITSEQIQLTVTDPIPVITVHPMNTSVLLHVGNESVMFSCEADGGSNIQYTWFTETSNGGRMIEGQTSNTLVLSSVTVDINNTQYYCIVSNNGGSNRSNSAHLTVNVYIEASIHPNTKTAEMSTEVQFECVADGYQSETFKYQWTLNGNEIPVANTKTLTITADEDGMYGCIVTNYWNMTANSNPVQLTVTMNPPVISTHPMDASVLLHYGNESVVFTCEANGGNNIEYTWYNETSNGGMVMEGETSNTLVLNVTVGMNKTQYYCIASNESGSDTSNSARLTVNVFIEAGVNPTTETAEVSTEVRFECVADGYQSETFKYQWTLNGSEIADANDKMLTVTADENGMYGCIVTNYWNMTANSNLAQLTVTRNPPVISTHPMDASVLLWYGNESVVFTCDANGGKNIEYTWHTETSNGSMVMGEKSNTLILNSVIVDMNNTQYYCIASNESGSDRSNSALLTVNVYIEASVHSNTETAEVSTEVQFECVVDGYQSETFKYQWIFNDNEIAGANNKTLTFMSVSKDDGGMYTCIVTNYLNMTAESAPLQFTVTSNPPVITTHPMNTTVLLHYGNESATFSCEVNGGGSNIQYTWYTGTGDSSMMIEGATSSELVLSLVNIKMNGTQYYCIASNNSGSDTSNTAHLTVDYAIDLPVITEHPLEAMHFIVNSSTDQITLNCAVDGEGVVYWEKDGVKINDSEIPITISENTLNIALDSITATSVGMYRCIASNIVGEVASNSTSVTVTGIIQATVEQSHQSAEVTSKVTFTCRATGYQSDMFTYQWRLNQTVIDNATSSNYIIPSVNESEHGMYECVVTNHWNEMEVSAPVQLNITRNLPVITMGPQNLTVLIRSDDPGKVEFSCVTEERADLYWFRDGKNVRHSQTDGMSSTYRANIRASNNGTQVYCEARNGSGIVRSDVANLTILVPPPVITENPQMLVNATYESLVTFRCEAQSFGNKEALKYHWLEIVDDNTTVPLDSGNNMLQFIAAPENDSTSYQCAVTNENSTVFSTVGRLNLLPIITKNPENVYAIHNTPVTLQCKAVGGNNITYKWTKDDTIVQIPDNGGSLTIASVQELDEGAYRCVAMNDRGETATSKSATVVVYDKFSLNINVTENVDNFVLEGADVYISCDVIIEPRPSAGIKITWNLKDTNVNLSSISEQVENNGTSSLILQLKNIERKNKGTYVCTVDDGNVEGGISVSTNVIVEYPPSITFEEVDPIEDGSELHLLCSASGIPTPSITIYRNDEKVSGPLPGGSLEYTVTSASAKNNHGTYSCNASSTSNITGLPFPTASKSIQVIVQGVPDKISRSNKLKDNPVNLTAVNLTWGEPFDGNSPITSYVVSCVNCSTTSFMVDGNVTELVIDGLTPGVVYKFSVVAVNKFGKGPDSNTVTAQSATPESAAVKSLEVVATNEVSVVIAWTDPELYATMIQEYIVHAVSDKHNKMITVPAGEHEANITNLVPTFSYNVSVVVTYQLASFMSKPVFHSVRLAECRACVQPVLIQPTNKNLTDLSFTLEWSPVIAGFLQNYTLSYRSVPLVKRQTDGVFSIPAGSTSYTVKNLTPYSSYCFSLQATYAQEGVVFSQKQSDEICDISTPPLASSAPVNLNVEAVAFTSVTVSWSAPTERNGIITQYKVYYTVDGATASQLTNGVQNLEYQIINLTPGTVYGISVSAITFHPYGDDLEGPKSDTVKISTSFEAPVLDSSLSPISSPNVDQFTVTITIPYIDESHGGMSHYLVVVVIGSLPSEYATPGDIPDNQLLPYDSAIVTEYNYYVATGGSSVNATHVLGNEDKKTVNSTEYFNRRLNPDQQYSYFVRVYSEHNLMNYSTSELSQPFVIASDDEEEETSSPLPVIIGAVAAVCLLIIILLIFLAMYMMRLHADKSSNQLASMQDSPSSKEHTPVSTPAAAVPELERRLSVPFINTQSVEVYTSVGPPTTVSIEMGGKPKPEVQWFKDDNPVVHRVLADGSLYIEKTELTDSGKYTARVTNQAGQSEATVHITASQPSPPEGDSGHCPIQVEDFARHVALSHSNMEELFVQEYADLEVDQTFTQHNAKIALNRNKNRYINIIPYDHSRVPLKSDYQTAGSDYINASFIDGYSGPGEYIATQGPVTSTFSDFWQMIWERRCNTIVMLTNLTEDDKIKCHQYWPSYGSNAYGRFRVTLKSVECLAEYSIRVFTVEQLNNGNDALEVHQFHYTVWPDHGVPDCGTPLLSFHSRVEKFFKRGDAPMVVHCSAGVGRTGTFIVIDTQMQRIRHLSNIDIFNNVRMLRYCRNYMVQTQSQYTFLHDVMLEAIMCGDTSLGAPVQNIVERLRELATVDQDTNETSFQKQFKTLTSDVLQERKFTYTVATAPKNAAKNRYQNHYAADQNFVSLSRDDDMPGYINASFVDGYRLRNAFIVTQGPLENTVEDFWQMIWEHKSHSIVMLTPLKENEEEQYCQYWPDEGTKEYGSYVVEVLKSYEPLGGELRREFKLSHVSKPMECRVISQFQFMDWPVDSCPENGASVIELIDSVERVQRKTGNGPITVHCNNGVGRSGTFCAMVASLERFKAEQMADIFQTVKKMRMQRAGIVQTTEQYQFLHKALLEAVERFDTYSNFT